MKTAARQNTKNKFGQYFTPKDVADFMIGLADISKESKILEPSCGEGIFIERLQQKGFQDITAYEIDEALAQDYSCVQYKSFVSENIKEKFDLIIGNPPYIRWKNLEDELKAELSTHPLWNKYFNSLCDYLYIFILKSIELLNENGQLIFICPEYWMNTTHSVSLRNYMVQNGYFEDIYHFNETPIFNKVTVSIVIFKFIKSKKPAAKISVVKFATNKKLNREILEKLRDKKTFQGVDYINVSQFRLNERWLLQTDEAREELKTLEFSCQKETQNLLFEDNKIAFNTIGDVCDIGNGLVSGLDKAFQVNGQVLNEYEKRATIEVVKARDLVPFFTKKITKYIFIREQLDESEVKERYPNFYLHFQEYKKDLQNRYQYNRKINYWEWVFLRNFELFNKKERRIFVPCKERISHKDFFRFAMADSGVFPTQDVTAIFRKTNTKESIEYLLAYLNLPVVFKWLKSNGIVKGNIVEFSERPLAGIPFKKIDWSNSRQVLLHDTITDLTKKYLSVQEDNIPEKVNHLFNELLQL